MPDSRLSWGRGHFLLVVLFFSLLRAVSVLGCVWCVVCVVWLACCRVFGSCVVVVVFLLAGGLAVLHFVVWVMGWFFCGCLGLFF